MNFSVLQDNAYFRNGNVMEKKIVMMAPMNQLLYAMVSYNQHNPYNL